MSELYPAEGGGDFSIGFLTALVSQELISCEHMLGKRGWTESEPSAYHRVAAIRRWTKSIDGRSVTAFSTAIGRMGQVASALETFMFLARCKPTDVFLTGIAGSLKGDKIHKADVVVATGARWRTQNRVFGDGDCDQYRHYHHPVTGFDADLSRQIQRFVSQNYPMKSRASAFLGDWNVAAGEVFTWEYVLDSKRIVSQINIDFPDALCVEMEAGGFLEAINRFSKLNGNRTQRGFIVRGISDLAAQKDKIDATRIAASRNAAEVAIDLAEHFTRLRMAEVQG